jgi:hypothetical protein
MPKIAIGVSAALAVMAAGFLLWPAEAAPLRGDISANMSLVEPAGCVRICSVWGVCWRAGKPRRCCTRFICRR